MEQREAAERQQDERYRRDPVIDAGGRGVAADRLGVDAHARSLPSSSAALRSSFSDTRLGPLVTECISPKAPAKAMGASEIGFGTPLQRATIGLVCRFSGRAA